MNFFTFLVILLAPSSALAEDIHAPLWGDISKGQSIENIKKTNPEYIYQSGSLYKDELINESCHVHVKIFGDKGVVSKVAISHGDFKGDNVYYCRELLISILQKNMENHTKLEN